VPSRGTLHGKVRRPREKEVVFFAKRQYIEFIPSQLRSSLTEPFLRSKAGPRKYRKAR